MTNKTNQTTLRPIGSGRLHADPTCQGARQESLRNWASERHGERDTSPVGDDPSTTERASAPRR
jgi:hypothetical protein